MYNTEANEQAVYTYGWDTVFSIPAKDVNQAIRNHHSSPKNFTIDYPTFTVQADFEDWQICPGGDGKNVRLSLPMKNGKIHYTKTNKEFSFNSGHAIVEIRLHYIPHTDNEEGNNGQQHALVALNQVIDDVPVMSVVSLTTDPPLATVSNALTMKALSDWGNANLGDFSHVFATVDLNRSVDREQWGFVTPNYTSYAYLDHSSFDDSLFAVLTMTQDRTGDSISEEMSPLAIPRGSVAGFLISQARWLYDLVRPAVMQAYPGLTEKNFLMTADATQLYLTDGCSVALSPVQHGGVTYYPKLTQLKISSNGQILTLTSFTETEIVPGIIATCQSDHWYKITLGNASAGQTILFQEAQKPSIVHEIHQTQGSHIAQIVIDVIAAIALIILTILTSGMALILGGLVIGLIVGANHIVPALIEKANKDDSPAIDLLIANAVSPIRWNSSKAFKLDYAGLNMSLQLGGNPTFT
ncbi:TULIP family P47-like protein [Burkholderia alba]|uniref:TULIP family P47-like protein n=1 Tax=Burkholderia alba TaxID=2683677 RepID=UPI002B05D147|nr:TULIP family P47-like protein [Burkholderia alba]